MFHSEDDATNKARKLFWLSLGLVVLLVVTLIANAALTYAGVSRRGVHVLRFAAMCLMCMLLNYC